jgi:hypothetical protein
MKAPLTQYTFAHLNSLVALNLKHGVAHLPAPAFWVKPALIQHLPSTRFFFIAFAALSMKATVILKSRALFLC